MIYANEATDLSGTCVSDIPEGKAACKTSRGGQETCETSRLLHFLDNRLTDGGEAVTLTRRRALPPGRVLVLIYVRG
jgi:hypothetical protein